MVGGQHHAPAAVHLGKTRYPLYRRLITNLTKVKILFIVCEGTVEGKKINIGKQQLQESFQGVTFI
jgi:hypothetical protein